VSKAIEEFFEEIIGASDESKLIPCAKDLIESLGGQSFVFVSLHPEDQSAIRLTHRFLIGCSPEWCQLYNANRWYLTDPCLEYAKVSTIPILGSELPLHTTGQRQMLEVAAEHGFRSGYVVPVHASEKGRIGVLYIGSDELPVTAELKFKKNRVLFRALALELLDWSSRALREEIIDKYGLTKKDVELVTYVRAGFKATDIANEYRVSVATVYRSFESVKEKIGVAHINAAVKFAEEHDLFA
jgi:DNA-binding CsgD family transcriptional regulator